MDFMIQEFPVRIEAIAKQVEQEDADKAELDILIQREGKRAPQNPARRSGRPGRTPCSGRPKLSTSTFPVETTNTAYREEATPWLDSRGKYSDIIT